MNFIPTCRVYVTFVLGNVCLCFFFSLKHLDDMLSSACLSAEAVYKVLYWDNHTKSSRSAHTHTHTHKETVTLTVLLIIYCFTTDLSVLLLDDILFLSATTPS